MAIMNSSTLLLNCGSGNNSSTNLISDRMSRKYGLIGYPLSHSFSKEYFTGKFERENIKDCSYELFPLEDISGLRPLIDGNEGLLGLNVTIPHKESVIPFLDALDETAKRVGAVNCIRIGQGKLTGF